MVKAKFVNSVVRHGSREHNYRISGYGVERDIKVIPFGRSLNAKNEASRTFTRSEALKTFEAQITWELARIAAGLPTGREGTPKRW